MTKLRMDTPKPPGNRDDPRSIEEQALAILKAADEKAEATVRSAIEANDGIDPGPDDLDTSGVRYAKEMAAKIQQMGNTLATERLYDAYADSNMTRASSADGFIATLDIIFQRVVGVLHGRTDKDAAKALRYKWSRIARHRSDVGWFVSRASKITLGTPRKDPDFWNDLEKLFRNLAKEFGDTLRANWTSAAWGEDGEQWYLDGSQGREPPTSHVSLSGPAEIVSGAFSGR